MAMNAVQGILGRVLFERQAKNKTGIQLAEDLERSGQELAMRFQNAAETESNHKVVTHIIGIEKWSQLRVQVAQGAPFREEEYDVHRPPQNTSWEDLRKIFEQTRRESVALARSLSSTQLLQKVRNNMYGEITTAAWMQYIYIHGNLESRRLR
jgi:hypothetical protein